MINQYHGPKEFDNFIEGSNLNEDKVINDDGDQGARKRSSLVGVSNTNAGTGFGNTF